MATPRNARPGMLLDPGAPINKGLVGWWPMWEGAGGKALDISGKNNHGTLTNGPLWSGGGVKFDGTDDYVVNAYVVNIPKVTHSAWVNFPAASASNANVIGFANGIGNGVQDKTLYITPSGVLAFYVYDGAGKTATSVNSIPFGRWVHVAATANGVIAKVYINGAEVGTVAAGDTFTGYSVPNIFIQGNTVLATYANIAIRDARVWSRGLSYLEVQQLYVNPNIGLWVPDITRYYIPAAAGGAKKYYLGGNAANRGQRGMGWAA